MLKTINNSCVKNVRNQRINSSKSSDYLSTKLHALGIKNTNKCTNYQLIQPNPLTFTSTLSTIKKQIFNLLNKSFTHNPQYLLIRALKEN
jgi:hypothetical protein